MAVADVEGLVVDDQAEDLAVGHVDDRLARLRVALGVRQRPQLMKPVEVGAGPLVGLTLVEVAPQPYVAIGQGEHRLRLAEHVEPERGLAHRPGVDGEAEVVAHASFHVGACIFAVWASAPSR